MRNKKNFTEDAGLNKGSVINGRIILKWILSSVGM
jgi:hypothetical protein